MALSGTFYGSTNNKYVQPKIVWSAVQSVEGNYTDVTASLYYSRTNTGYTTYGTWNGSITINGTSTSGSKSVTITYNSNSLALSATTRVYHNADGTKSITISASGGISGTSTSSTTISATVTLDTIPRATTPTVSASAVNMGSAVTITLNRASSSFTHKLYYSWYNSGWQTIATGVGTSYSWTIPLTFANSIPSATSGWGTIRCETYNGSTLIGTKDVTFTANVPSTVVPTISSVSISEATEGIAAKFGAFVQNKSTLAVAITASGAYGSTITGYETYIQSVPYRKDSFTSNVITANGTIGIVTTVTDSRGRTAQVSKSVTVLEYFQPEISELSAWRITTAGVTSDEGTRIALKLKYAIASVNGKNDRTYNFKYRKSTDTEFTSFASGTASANYDNTEYFTDAPSVLTDYAYVVRVEIADYFQTTVHEVQIPTAFTIMDFRNTGKGMAIGKVSEKDALEVAMNSEFTGQMKIFAPSSDQADSGFIRMYRADGTLAAFLATSDGGNGLNLHFYSGGAWSGVVKFTQDGAVVAKNLSYGTATTG